MRDVIQEASHIKTQIDTEEFVRAVMLPLLHSIKTGGNTVITSNAAVDLAAALRDLLVLHRQEAKMRRQIDGLKKALRFHCGPKIRKLRKRVGVLEACAKLVLRYRHRFQSYYECDEDFCYDNEGHKPRQQMDDLCEQLEAPNDDKEAADGN